MNIRKLIRLLLKISATPFILVLVVIWHFMILAISAFEWIYEASEFEKKITQSILDDNKKLIKKWFTTI